MGISIYSFRIPGRFIIDRTANMFLSLRRSQRVATLCRMMSSGIDETTHFGFQQVRAGDKARMVGEVFSGVANRYDIMNDMMSGGVHRCWKDAFVNMLRPSASVKCLDVAGGTGDIVFRILDHMASRPSFSRGSFSSPASTSSTSYAATPSSHATSAVSGSSSFSSDSSAAQNADGSPHNIPSVVVADINPDMLAVGQMRAAKKGYPSEKIAFVQADAESLPFEDASFDMYTIAFGIRNCTHVDRVLREAYRVLKRGGRFACLEFSHVTMPGLAQVYDAYSFNVIPLLGQLVANDRKSYQYLVESIRQFPDQERFADMIRDAGFSAVRYENLTFGVSAIHMGTKFT